MKMNQHLPFMVKMNGFFATVLYIGLVWVLKNHERATSSKGCNADEYEVKFQRVVFSEFATFSFLILSFFLGITTMLTMAMIELNAEEVVVVDSKGCPPTLKTPKYLKNGEVFVMGLSVGSYMGLLVVGVFLFQYKIAGISCGGA